MGLFITDQVTVSKQPGTNLINKKLFNFTNVSFYFETVSYNKIILLANFIITI